MRGNESFFNLYNHDLIRVAIAVPEVRVADPAFNASRTIFMMRKAVEKSACIVILPTIDK